MWTDKEIEKVKSPNIVTPAYVYKLSFIDEQYKKLRTCLGSDVDIVYSVKANSNEKIIKRLNNFDVFFDCASIAEISLVLRSGIDSKKISFVGPAKTYQDIKYAVESGVGHIICESLLQVKVLSEVLNNLKKKQKILIRINPNLKETSGSLVMGGVPSQFGIDEDNLQEIFDFLEYSHLIELEGFHFFLKSQVFDHKELEEKLQRAHFDSKRLAEKFGLNIKRVNLGGGFAIGYYSGQDDIKIGKIDICKPYQKKHVNTVESGRFLVAPAGVFVTSVIDIKTSYGKQFVIVDGGLSCNAAVAGIGQIIKRNYKIKVVGKKELEETYTVAGPSCTPIDILAVDIQLPKLEVGDKIVFLNCGAYGASYSPVNFLHLKKPSEYIID